MTSLPGMGDTGYPKCVQSIRTLPALIFAVTANAQKTDRILFQSSIRQRITRVSPTYRKEFDPIHDKHTSA